MSANPQSQAQAPAMVGHYPTDPTSAIGDLRTYFTNGDVKYLAHGMYDLLGFGLQVTIGEPGQAVMVDPQILADAHSQLITTMQSSQINIPAWAKPFLQMGLQALLSYIQGAATIQHFQAHGVITKVGPNQPQGQPKKP